MTQSANTRREASRPLPIVFIRENTHTHQEIEEVGWYERLRWFEVPQLMTDVVLEIPLPVGLLCIEDLGPKGWRPGCCLHPHTRSGYVLKAGKLFTWSLVRQQRTHTVSQ